MVGGQLGEQHEWPRWRGGEGPRPAHRGREAVVVPGEVQDRGLGAECLQVGGVDLQDRLRLLQRPFAVAVHEADSSKEGPGPGQVGVGGERGLDVLQRAAAALQTRDPRQSQPRGRVRRVLGQDLPECGRSLARVVALQEELAGREPGGVVERTRRDRLVQRAQRVVRVLVVPAGEVEERPTHRRELRRREAAGAIVVVDEALEEVAGSPSVAVAVQQDAQFDPGRRAGGAALPRPLLEHGLRLVHPADIHERGPEQRTRPAHPPRHPPLGCVHRAVVVPGLPQRRHPPGQRGGVPVQGRRAQRPHGFVISPGPQRGEAVGILGEGDGPRGGTEQRRQHHEQVRGGAERRGVGAWHTQ